MAVHRFLILHNRMDNSLTAIFGKRALNRTSATDYVDWATEMLVHGHDSRSLRILAGLDKFTYTADAEDYFVRAIHELGLDMPERDTAIRSYACKIVEKMIDGRITCRTGVGMLYQICVASDYPRELIVWYQLADALDSIKYGFYPHTYPTATSENFDELAKHEAEHFVASVCGEGVRSL